MYCVTSFKQGRKVGNCWLHRAQSRISIVSQRSRLGVGYSDKNFYLQPWLTISRSVKKKIGFRPWWQGSESVPTWAYVFKTFGQILSLSLFSSFFSSIYPTLPKKSLLQAYQISIFIWKSHCRNRNAIWLGYDRYFFVI